jgi:hypothetical protein
MPQRFVSLLVFVPNRGHLEYVERTLHVRDTVMPVVVHVSVTAHQHHTDLQGREASGGQRLKKPLGIGRGGLVMERQHVVVDEVAHFVLVERCSGDPDFQQVQNVSFVHVNAQRVSVSNNWQVGSCFLIFVSARTIKRHHHQH